MDKTEFKNILVKYIKGMIDKWFDTNSINDVLAKSLSLTLINANKDKYDCYLDYICDSNGQVCINDFLDNLIDNFKSYNIDLTKYNIPMLPNKILIISKQDLLLFKQMCVQNISQNYDNS